MVGLLLSLQACTGPNEAQLEQQTRQLLEKADYSAVEQLLGPLSTQLTNADLHNMLGFALLENGKTAQAINSFNQAIKLNNQNYKYFYNRGNAYLKDKQTDEALADFDKALGLETKVYEIYLNRAAVLLSMNRAAEALTDLDRAVQLNQTDKNIYFNRGQAYLALRQFAQAQADFAASSRLAPGFARAWFALAVNGEQAGASPAQICDWLKQAAQLGHPEATTLIKTTCK
ncbi:MAG: tetratricopeptide repeat protein [Bernardetiaceae bacterium]|nr:tetratricopeptide repeat protein [Bernardetiaceae bacterium]